MYEIRFSKGAGKYLKKLDRNTKDRIKKSLLELAEDPYGTRNLDIKRLAGYEDSYRLRVGKYRALYTIIDKEVVIFVFDLDSRGDIYK
ncbi:type II toxin-antitoxin system RelE/ParE family toxin [Terrilactibacillus laevilacticus]|uniref:Type II toxin-antitoxin system RelE/ParE family toxin n=2 Tax=Terrilactibacillus laevilacticus TaxID=1380157 RepID=A0ABW5PPB7_9BACI